MKVRAQIAMVLNLDKCIGCHTCSVTCKNVWTSRPGVEYAWFNNVETKPGIGYPKEWENQNRWQGGWVRKDDGSLEPRQGGRLKLLMRMFANPALPQIDDYYEPFTFDYEHLQNAPEGRAAPTARPRSLITGQRMEKIEWGPNWEEILGGEFAKRSKDANLDSFDAAQKAMIGKFENTFMMYLPRLCEHCLNPACVASCPSGSIYKREDDGIVLIDQDKCRGWRMCVSGCPYKKIYYNWQTGKAEKCIFCYPRIEAGQPTVCSETCVGRIRYLGVMLYDADRIAEAASVTDEKQLYQAQLDIFLDPHDPQVIAQALADGVPEAWLESARNSPVYKMAIEWKVALPLHPEYRTLPMVWYVPPLSPIHGAVQAGHLGVNGELPDLQQMRIPLQYLANLLTAGDTKPVENALTRMLAMRAFMRSRHVDQVDNQAVLKQAGLNTAQVDEMYRIMALANYEDRFVIPSAHREYAENAFDVRGGCGFSFGNGCSDGQTGLSVFGGAKRRTIPIKSMDPA
ncbi:nitrate reductase subunit beta [Massilia sp. W12]|uniref:nitrate reductase subunit beta n=1 Tax=Massilia sp. W12 TaxID=3126507 RepID=UPI0030D36B18